MTLEEKAKAIGSECLAIGIMLAERGEGVRKRTAALRTVNVVVSMMVFVALIPSFATAIGSIGATMISVLAGIVLLLDTILPVFVGKDSAERYEDFSRYMMGYKDMLDETLVDTSLTPPIKRARLTETISLAQSNMRDVRSKWPLLVREALLPKLGNTKGALTEATEEPPRRAAPLGDEPD